MKIFNYAAVLIALNACSEPIKRKWSLNLGSPSVSTPLITKAFIAVGHEQGITVVENTGERRCVFDAHGAVISAPKTDGRFIYFGSTNYMFYAIKPDCSEVWNFPSRDRIKSDALLAQGMVILSSYDGHVYALNAADGKMRWLFPTKDAMEPNTGVPEAPEVNKPDNKRKPPRSRRRRRRPKKRPSLDTLFDVAEGKDTMPQATDTSGADTKKIIVGDFSYSSPLAIKDTLYIGNLDGTLYAIDISTGVLRWYFESDGPITSSPKANATKDVLYFGSNDGHVYALSLSDRPPLEVGQGVHQRDRLLWRFKTTEWVNSSACIEGNQMYIGSNDRFLYSIDLSTGKEKWKAALKGPALAIPVLYRNLVFAAGGSGDGTLYAFQAASGEPFWSYHTKGKIEADPVISGDTLYLASTDGMLYAFSIVATEATE